jgi:hypothetical protein
MIVAAFAGVGKTYFCNQVENSKDFVCMPYKYFMDDYDPVLDGERVKADINLRRNFEYPRNYIEAILENADKYKYFVIPSDTYVLGGLDVPYVLCYPVRSAKEEYFKRFVRRGNSEQFLEIFIDNWDHFMNILECMECQKIILKEDEYLLDVKRRIDLL